VRRKQKINEVETKRKVNKVEMMRNINEVKRMIIDKSKTILSDNKTMMYD
jgi:hypothetical protein